MSFVVRRLIPSVLSLSIFFQAIPAVAAMSPPTGDLKAFEVGFEEGSALLERGEALAAARAWVKAASHLPESSANRDNRATIHELIAEAYTQALTGSQDQAVLREAGDVLREYCDGFTRAFGTEAVLSPKITAARDDFAGRLRPEPAPTPEPEPAPPPAPEPPAPAPTSPSSRPWKGLVIGGAALTAVGVGAGVLAAVFAARGRSLQHQFDDPANNCDLDMPVGECATLLSQGKTSNAVAIAGLIGGTLLIGGGVALLVTGVRRRQAPPSLAPAFGPGFVGLRFQRSF